MSRPPALLEVRDLEVRFRTHAGTVKAVNGVSLQLRPGESLAIVGESGSGKSVAALSILGLIAQPAGEVVAGEILFEGRDLLRLSAAQLRSVRGRRIAMVFQDASTSLNPVLTVGRQIAEVLLLHQGVDKSEARRRTVELMERVGIPDAAGRVHDHPHEFSGGQRQRIMIAMALAGEPALLIADEPTTALDVTVQAQIVDLVRELQRAQGMSLIWITHDLALVAGVADRVAVMYAGRIVEESTVAELFAAPAHPYTQGLLRSMPLMDASREERLIAIPGQPPDSRTLGPGCSFAPRCPHADARCHVERPTLEVVRPGQRTACWRWRDIGFAAAAS